MLPSSASCILLGSGKNKNKTFAVEQTCDKSSATTTASCRGVGLLGACDVVSGTVVVGARGMEEERWASSTPPNVS